MVSRIFQLFTNGEQQPAGAPPAHFLALIVRCEDDLLFETQVYGPCPFLAQLEGASLPPTLGTEAVLLWARDSGKLIGLCEEKILAHDLRPPEPFQPFADAFMHVVIVDVCRAEFRRIRDDKPNRVVLTSAQVQQSISKNFFFRTIADAYRLPRAA